MNVPLKKIDENFAKYSQCSGYCRFALKHPFNKAIFSLEPRKLPHKYFENAHKIGSNHNFAKFPNRKGDINLKAVFWMIFFAVVLSFIFAVVIPSIGDAAERSASYNKCKITVGLTSWTKSPLTGKSAFKTNCPRDSTTFYDHNVIESVEGKDRVLYVQDPASDQPSKQFAEINDQLIFFTLSKKLKDCWDKFEQGKGMPIDQNLFHRQKDNCHICSEISFSLKQDQNFGNFNDYLTTHQYANDFEHDTIFDYFNNNLVIKSPEISSTSSYKIVYLQNIPPQALQGKKLLGLDAEKQQNQIVFGKTEDINCRSYN